MRIADVRIHRVSGILPTDGPLWEERLVRPVDVYPEFRDRDDHEGGVQVADGFAITTYFVEVATDDGLVGRGGPVPETVARIVAGGLRGLLVGRDPLAGEQLWDLMHRVQVHGRQGQTMLAISAVDVALWDLDEPGFAGIADPVFALAFGPTRPVDTLLVGGEVVVEDGELRTADPLTLAAELRRESARMAEAAPR